MERSILVFMLLAIVQSGFSQPDSILIRPDFFGQSTDYETADGFEKIEVGGHIQAFRKFFPHTNVTSEEYLHYERDTFLYVRYDSLEHEILTQGKLFPAFCCGWIDTVILFDPETYVESYYLKKHLKWSKEGLWKEQNGELYSRGNYRHNQKIGEWYFWDGNTQQGSYRMYDHKGQVVDETPQNLLLLHDVQKKKAALVGVWKLMPNIDASDENVRLFRLTNQADYPYFNLYTFSADSVWFKYRSGKILSGIWDLSADNVILIKGNDAFWAGELEIRFFERGEVRSRIRRTKEEKKEK